jgi:hypothetical protein
MTEAGVVAALDRLLAERDALQEAVLVALDWSGHCNEPAKGHAGCEICGRIRAVFDGKLRKIDAIG